MASASLAQTSSHRGKACLIAGWSELATQRQRTTVKAVVDSYNPDKPPLCKHCNTSHELSTLCWECNTWACAACSHTRSNRVHISKLKKCINCHVDELRKFSTESPPTDYFVQSARGLAAGFLSLEQHGGTFGYRHSSLRMLFKWGERMGLEVFPGSPIVYKHFAAHRLLVQGVNSATLEQDFIAISVMHSSVKERLGLNIHNPVRNSEIKALIKHLTKSVRIKANATVSMAFRDFIVLINSLDKTDPRQLHTCVMMQCVGFGGLRRGAAEKMRLKRTNGEKYSTKFCEGSDVRILYHPTYGWVLCLRKELDKCLPAGQDLWTYIPDVMICGLTPVTDFILWVTSYPLPDGPLFACPSGPSGTSFNSTEYTALDLALARTWAKCFPRRLEEKVAPHSLRKMIIQAFYDMLKLLGVVPDEPVGEFIGWWNKKKITRASYAQLSMVEALKMLHDLDPTALPWQIATVSCPPTFYDDRD